MTVPTRKLPSAEHPITIAPADQHVTVRARSTVVADTEAALVLREAAYPPVYYLPLEDVDQSLLRASETKTYCPFKGEASYASIDLGDRVIEDAMWFYAEPYDAVAEITGHVAFYPNQVEIGSGSGS